ncbi:hypothetical protein I79_010648 [Cricetulus griseus]|uniref:Uncharacterized protein n=1 Tax=Cricetulus griseus TaxID=10029 RepID=G3HJ14_CRIGR|nr:hypothetical protein I79_010648 [Cricetulus griseus]
MQPRTLRDLSASASRVQGLKTSAAIPDSHPLLKVIHSKLHNISFHVLFEY